MIHGITHKLPKLQDINFIPLAIEANADAAEAHADPGVCVLTTRTPSTPPSAPTSPPSCTTDIAGEEAFFGDVASFVKSDVLMRLRVSSGSPDGVMCFGSRDPAGFRARAGPPSSCSSSPRCWKTPFAPGSTCRNNGSGSRDSARGLARLAEERAPARRPHAGGVRARRRHVPRLLDELSRQAADAGRLEQVEACRIPCLAGRSIAPGTRPHLDGPCLLVSPLLLPGSSTSAGSPTTPASAPSRRPSCHTRCPRPSPNATWRS